jgi:Ras family protein T1
MTTFHDPKTTLEYLAYLGFDSSDRTTAALKLTKPRSRRRRRTTKVERTVVNCYVLGSSGSGKSTLLSAFLSKPFSPLYHPTIKPVTAVNSVELQGGKQCYLILSELGELEPAILENPSRLDTCDVLCYTYDSSDPDSFSHIDELRQKYPQLDELPAVYAALKADLDKTTQRFEMPPEEYTRELGMAAPVHVSAKWSSINELFAHIAEAALVPGNASPRMETERKDRSGIYVAVGVVAVVAVVMGVVWRRTGGGLIGFGGN